MSAALVPQGLEPLAVWDTRDRAWFEDYDRCAQRVEYAKAHIPEAGRTYRAEFYVLDAPFAVVSRYRRGADGYKYRDPETGAAAVEEPAVVALAELPPAELMRG